jgi:hypothetical protein
LHFFMVKCRHVSSIGSARNRIFGKFMDLCVLRRNERVREVFIKSH